LTTSPPELLPGRSALEEAGRSWKIDLAGIGVVLLMVVSAAALNNPARSIALAALLVPGLMLTIVGYRSWMGMNRRKRRERQAGYTTLYDSAGIDLWQLDPRTGAVIRRPREPMGRRRADK
jgi:hypothetical protein